MDSKSNKQAFWGGFGLDFDPRLFLGIPSLHAIPLSGALLPSLSLLLALCHGHLRSIPWVLCSGAGRASLRRGAAAHRARFSPCPERGGCGADVHASLSPIRPVFAAGESQGSCLSAVRGQVAEGRESRELSCTAVPKPCHVSGLSRGGQAGALAAAAQQASEHQCLELRPAARDGPGSVVSPMVRVSQSLWWHWWWLFGLSCELVLMGAPPGCLPPALTVASVQLGDVVGFE